MSSIACSTAADTLTLPDQEGVGLDSVQKLLPPGFYLLTENGARNTIKAKIDAQAYEQKWRLADDALSKMAANVSVMAMERNQARERNIRDEGTIQLLTTKLKTANTWKWIGLVGMTILTTKIIFKP